MAAQVAFKRISAIWAAAARAQGKAIHMIDNEIGAVFVPVRDIEAARDWYCGILGLEPRGDIQFGHLYVVPMRNGSGLVLDAKDFAGPHDRKPAFHFNTDDVAGAYASLRDRGVELVGEVVDGIFFTFKDPDGNLLMVADVPPAPRG
jgi:catechol 2,3-dioxygenase-like lactoylglutathione lyase family enzyme